MKFIDEATVHVKAGHGGDGCVSFRREKYIPRGGPDGGDGGNGAAVIFVADPTLNTLLDLALHPHLTGENGANGGSQQSNGKCGIAARIALPVGTQVFYEDRLVADLSAPAAEWVAARGGHGGKGNAFFKTAQRQTPDFAQHGQEGEAFSFRLVLKSVADVGLVGLPNVGKSTLVTRVSRATPKIADYPFTTLTPHLGVVALSDGRRFVIADIPGLIPDAHLGKGLGITFLKHIERTKVLAQLIDLSGTPDEMIANDQELVRLALLQFEAIDNELRSFSPILATKPRLVVFSKCDIELCARAAALCQPLLTERGFSVHAISSLTNMGMPEFLEQLYVFVQQAGLVPVE